jgi:hypothetical protein
MAARLFLLREPFHRCPPILISPIALHGCGQMPDGVRSHRSECRVTVFGRHRHFQSKVGVFLGFAQQYHDNPILYLAEMPEFNLDAKKSWFGRFLEAIARGSSRFTCPLATRCIAGSHWCDPPKPDARTRPRKPPVPPRQLNMRKQDVRNVVQSIIVRKWRDQIPGTRHRATRQLYLCVTDANCPNGKAAGPQRTHRIFIQWSDFRRHVHDVERNGTCDCHSGAKVGTITGNYASSLSRAIIQRDNSRGRHGWRASLNGCQT